MAVPVRAVRNTVLTRDPGESRAMHLHKPCGYSDCQEHRIASVGDEDLCCDHFVQRCYEVLQRIEAERAQRETESDHSSALARVNTCLQGALEVSLRSESLSNLQKARLLDIMLWAGEFIHRTEAHRLGGPSLGEFLGSQQKFGERAAYKKPQIRSSATLLPH